MRNSKSIQVDAKNLDKALEEAAQQLGVAIDQVKYEVTAQAGGGFLSFLAGSKRISIKAWANTSSRPRNGERRQGARSGRQQSETTTDRRELSETEVDALVNELKSFCEGVCSRMANEDVTVATQVHGDRLVLNIDNEYLAQQINRNSKIAESLEHLMRKKPRHLKRELPFRIFIDVAGQRMERERELIDMAKDLSMKVHENQKPIVLNYKSSYDRKIIHMALDQDDRVYTKSIGSGTNRKLMILPSQEEEMNG